MTEATQIVLAKRPAGDVTADCFREEKVTLPALTDGQVLVRRRAPNGLLGGMTEVPTTQWSHDFDPSAALVHAPRFGRKVPRWRRLPGVVTHVFTHFPLELVVYLAEVPVGASAPEGTRWSARAELAGEAFPNVMRKVLAHAL